MAKDKSKKAAEPDTETETVKVKKDKGEKAHKPAGASFGDLGGPGAGGMFTAADHVDELLLISPHEIRTVSTTFGDSEAVEADIVVLNRKNVKKSETIDGGLIFGRVVIGQLKQAVNNRTRVVGTLIQDEASKKAGQSAPYRLTAPSEEDIELAKAYLDSLNPLR